jgi:putative heme-binding domain-containing protein
MPAFHSALRTPHLALLLSAVLCLLSPYRSAAQDDPFAAGVRTTPWLSPADEQKQFKLPAGFEINLVVAEPEIQKPLNMAFDERGRIWLTCTEEYPYAAPPDRPGKDSIRILEDTDGDGRYEKMTVFADGLNIPIGIYPWKGGCVAYSIPNIWHLEDADGDGVCDKRSVLYGPFDTSRDTHGMVNSFRRGWDGWIYACHGFNNDSRVKGRDGNEVHMQSGNTFRFKLDGSRIEHFTHGQVNPFGMCFDEWFNIFTADCHSKPIYQLLRGGYYPSFGKPHDGLGFVPPMMDHLHGSTAICGLVKYGGQNFPEEYRGDFYSGNVMTSRINRNKPEYHGSTIKAIEQPDFLSTGDPWFRPVDIQIGPDGAMYIADFYNRIIGHYEVPLPHPGRDRTSGRIWRVTYKGEGNEAAKSARGSRDAIVGNGDLRGVPRDLGQLSNADLLEYLANHGEDMRAFLLLRDKGRRALPTIRDAWNKLYSQKIIRHILWLLAANDALTDDDLVRTEFRGSPWDMTHLLKILAERPDWTDKQRDFARRWLAHGQTFVARAAADALGRHPTQDQIRDLLSRYKSTAAADNHLRYTIRMALRDHVAVLVSPALVDDLKLSDTDWQELASVCLAIPTQTAAAILLRYLQSHDDNVTAYLQHAARYADASGIDDIVLIAKSKAAADVEFQAQIVQSLANGLAQRGGAGSRQLTNWANQVAEKLLASSDGDGIAWTAVPIDGLPPSENPWVIAPRPSRDGKKESLFYYSLPKGEQRTGIYRSGTFVLPEKLSFWCAGHSGLPNQPLNNGNYVRLRDAKTHEVLAESRPPRNDTARQFTWDLSTHAGKDGYIELVDGDTGNAYAWLAVGRFSLEALNPSDTPRKQQLAAEIIGKLKLETLKPQLISLVSDTKADTAARAAVANAIVAFHRDARASALAAVIADPLVPDELRPKMGRAIAEMNDALLFESLREVVKRLPMRLQTTLGDTLASDAAGAATLLTLIESGNAAPRLLSLPNISNKLAALKNAELDQRAAAITAKLPPANAVLDALITDRRRAFARSTTSVERGQTVFAKHCATCHQIAGKGATIGPQLDGIANRGIDRLLEDIIDPNRNVDVAFRTTTLRLADGRVVSGLVRREEDSQIVLADAQGKEFTVGKSDIDEQQKTPLSLMPANVGELVAADEFADLMAYLLSQRAANGVPK